MLACKGLGARTEMNAPAYSKFLGIRKGLFSKSSFCASSFGIFFLLSFFFCAYLPKRKSGCGGLPKQRACVRFQIGSLPDGGFFIQPGTLQAPFAAFSLQVGGAKKKLSKKKRRFSKENFLKKVFSGLFQKLLSGWRVCLGGCAQSSASA